MTPQQDEREHLAELICRVCGGTSADLADREIADAILAAGYSRRTEAAPTDEYFPPNKLADDALCGLVKTFADALLAKLRKAELKYGHGNSWLATDWADKLRDDIRAHTEKGDPRDVAAYCAFAWHHGWSLARRTATGEARDT